MGSSQDSTISNFSVFGPVRGFGLGYITLNRCHISVTPDLLEKTMKLLGLVLILLAQQLLTVAYEKDATCYQELMDSLSPSSSSGDP